MRTIFTEILDIVLFIPKIILIILFFPLYLAFKAIRQKSASLFYRVTLCAVALIILLPNWIGGYVIFWQITQNILGYTPYITDIVGTGSMYPTWPKGEKGKTPSQLANEVVSTAGFLRYPNGIELNGKRYLNYTLGRGDIITARNDSIEKTTSEVYGTPSGVLKRIVALGGDSVEIRDGIFYLNGQAQKEQYTAKPRSTYGEDFLRECQKYSVPEDSVFLMGDNRKGSADSREFGPVKYSEIDSVIPLTKQVGTLDKNWHDTTNDLNDSQKPTIDRSRFIELLNQKRKAVGSPAVKYENKLEKAAQIWGMNLLKNNKLIDKGDYSAISSTMAKAGYWNSYVWQWSLEGYYSADEIIEDYIDRDSTESKNVWFDNKFDDMGIAEVKGTINGCPTQIIVVFAAGYVPPNYKQSDIDGWKNLLDQLNGIKPGWESLKNDSWFYNNHKSDVDKIIELINLRITRVNSIYVTMRDNKWLSSEQNQWIKDDNNLYSQEESLATKLNGI
jgi:signal peptidase I